MTFSFRLPPIRPVLWHAHRKVWSSEEGTSRIWWFHPVLHRATGNRIMHRSTETEQHFPHIRARIIKICDVSKVTAPRSDFRRVNDVKTDCCCLTKLLMWSFVHIFTEVDRYFQAVWHRSGWLDPSFIWTVFIHGLQYSITHNGRQRRAQLDTTVPNTSYACHGGESFVLFGWFFFCSFSNKSQSQFSSRTQGVWHK